MGFSANGVVAPAGPCQTSSRDASVPASSPTAFHHLLPAQHRIRRSAPGEPSIGAQKTGPSLSRPGIGRRSTQGLNTWEAVSPRDSGVFRFMRFGQELPQTD